MPRLRLGLVIHNHQPVGNYNFVIEDQYERAYGPMLEALERHPGVRVAIHNSGCLLDWIEQHRPEYIERLRTLCERGQVEVLTGGYYEPVLPMILDTDKLGQIRKLSAYVEEYFGQAPRGLWLTERVWEPSLPAPLADAGVEWTLVDDEHFQLAGMDAGGIDGYFLTEDQGRRVALFASSAWLRYAIPWRNVDDLMRDLRAFADNSAAEHPYVVLGDDGEKFGGWPTTYAHVWEQGWMDSFFSAIEASGDWLDTMTPGAYMREQPARGLVYLPAASYSEMMEWALPPESAAAYRRATSTGDHGGGEGRRFMRGGFWRMFLAKYPEANAMHKRGLRIAGALSNADAPGAREALWAAQCNCPYWHGVFGGLYLRHIRRAANTNLVRAERLASTAAARTPNTGPDVRVLRADLDFDGHDEILIQTADVSVMIHPALGGMISEWDLRRRDLALLDVLARRPEAYHDDLAAGVVDHGSGDATRAASVRPKRDDLDTTLIFDRHRRAGLQEWILDPGSSLDVFARGDADVQFDPLGRWDARVDERERGILIELNAAHGGWRITKRLTVPPSGESLAVAYEIQNESVEPRSGIFSSEWNIAPPQSVEGDDTTAILDIEGVTSNGAAGAVSREGVRSFSFRGSAGFGLRCEIDAPSGLWHFPVETVSSSEGGIERVFQGVCIAIVRGLELGPGERAQFSLSWSVKEPL